MFKNLEIPIVDLIKIVLLIAISIGIHALLHLGQEVHYDFNPLVGKFEIKDDPRFK